MAAMKMFSALAFGGAVGCLLAAMIGGIVGGLTFYGWLGVAGVALLFMWGAAQHEGRGE